jgi:polyribonucleotide nucleotidyltransferase
VIIGTGGKVIKEIQEKTGTEISIEDTGKVVVSSPDKEKAEKALKIIEALTKDVKVGEIYDGTVKDLLDFGALVEVLPGKVGLLHVSEIADTYVKNVDDYLKIGDTVKVKVIETGENGKFSLSKRAAEDPDYVANERPARPRNNGFRGGGDRGGDKRRSFDRGGRR